MQHTSCSLTTNLFRCILSSFLLFSGINAIGQEDTAYVRTYGGPYFEEGRQIIECAAGGYAVIGTTGSDVANNTNFYLLRLDESLECMWSKSIGGLQVEKGYSIVEDADFNFYLTGYTNSEGAGGYDVIVYKTDYEGNELWRHTYGGTDWDFGYKMIAHPEEGFLICGETYSMGNGGSDGYLLHIDADGEVMDEWTYGGEGDDEMVDMIVSSNLNEILIAGTWQLSDTFIQTACMTEISMEGNLVDTIFPMPDSISHGISIVENQERILFTSIKNSSNSWRGHLLQSYQSDLTPLWQHGGTYMQATEVIPVSDGYIVLGITDLYGAGGKGTMVEKINPEGIYISAPTFGGVFDDFGYCGIFDSFSRPIFVGKSNSYTESEYENLYLVRFPDDNIQQEYILNNQYLNCFTVDLTENSENSSVSYTVVDHEVRFSGTVSTCSVFNSMGQMIVSETNKNSIDMSDFKPGVYYFKINNKAIVKIAVI